MSFLKRYFSGEGVSDDVYNEKEPEDDYDEPVASPRVTSATVRPSGATAAARQDNVVNFSARTTASQELDGESRRPATTFTRGDTGSFVSEASGYTREFSSTDSMGNSTSRAGYSSRSLTPDSGDAYVVFKRLKDFTMASQVADKMVERKIVILNLESCDDEVARRVLDFIGGVAYACSSMVKRIAGRVFMITPKGVNSDGEFFDELRSDMSEINYGD